MTRLLLIYAGPTPWDDEDRVVGNQSLPLTEQASAIIQQAAQSIQHPLTSVYRFKKNEAAEQASKIILRICGGKRHDSAALDEWNLGLWQGLTRSELKFRFPTVSEQWKQDPLSVNPPDGEMFADAVDRLRGGLKRIVKRNRGFATALCLRPLAMQIVLGLLRREAPQTIAGHLHNVSPVETIEIGDEKL
jgi:broad specificity phosphatase PhoE